MEVNARGTKLFESFASTAETIDGRYQGALISSLIGGVEGTVYGQLWLEYVIDFYQPAMVITGLDRLRHGKPKAHSTSDSSDPDHKDLKVQCRPRHLLDPDLESLDPPPVRFHPNPSSYPGAPGSQSSTGLAASMPSTPPPPKVPSRK
jgi:hypothetical protein